MSTRAQAAADPASASSFVRAGRERSPGPPLRIKSPGIVKSTDRFARHTVEMADTNEKLTQPAALRPSCNNGGTNHVSLLAEGFRSF